MFLGTNSRFWGFVFGIPQTIGFTGFFPNNPIASPPLLYSSDVGIGGITFLNKSLNSSIPPAFTHSDIPTFQTKLSAVN